MEPDRPSEGTVTYDQSFFIQGKPAAFTWECADEAAKSVLSEIIDRHSDDANWHSLELFREHHYKLLSEHFEIEHRGDSGARVRLLGSEQKKVRSRERLLARINARKEKLAEVAEELKSHFVGIDDVIDSVIKSIMIWYVMPELMTRPCIVCLWGMTGVGKTDLVRKLAKALDYLDRYVETQLATDNRSYMSTVRSILSSSSVEPGQAGILLLDEVQRFRTVDEQGNEIRNGNFSDVWSLLSDGSFAASWDLKRDLHEMLQDLAWEKMRKERGLKASDPGLPVASDRSAASDRSIASIKDIVADLQNGLVEATKGKLYPLEEALDPEEDEEEEGQGVEVSVGEDGKLSYGRISQIGSWEARSFKSKLGLSEPIGEIMSWSIRKRINVLIEKMNDPATYQGRDYTKLLIFVSGNLDEAFKQAMAVNNADIDADSAHIRSKNVDIADIKGALTTRFKPEQIARFGNIHVIYPSLSKGSYQEIISRKLREAAASVRELHGIEVVTDQSFDDMIYGNGVFPLQGTRPVFTTLAAAIGLSFPRAVLLALESGSDAVSISYSQERKAFICSAGDAKIEVPYAGDLDALREKCRHDSHRRREVAVHEAGHAVVHAVLNKIAPLQTNALTIDGNGFTHCHDMGQSPQGVMRGIAVGIAGTVAEEMVFGTRNAGRGNRHDIDETTSRIAELIRRSGVVDGFPAMVMSNDRFQVYDADVDRTNEKIRQLIRKAQVFVGTLLKDHFDILIDVAEALFQKGELSAAKFVEVCDERIPVKVLEEEDILTAPYNDLFAEAAWIVSAPARGTRDYCEELYNIFCEDPEED